MEVDSKADLDRTPVTPAIVEGVMVVSVETLLPTVVTGDGPKGTLPPPPPI